MTATLQFDLSDPEDKTAHARACKADELCSILSCFLETLRTKIKHSEADPEPYREMRAELLEELDDRGIDLDTLWS